MTTDHLIHVSEQAWGDEKPRAALIHVTLSADKLFSGRAAFDKAVELRRLVSALGERDIADTAVALTGATLDVSTGLFTRSSSVTYRVRIRLDIDKLAEGLDAVADCKQAKLSHIEWDYAASASDELMAECATRAMTKAKRLAAALGITLASVHSVHEEQIAEAQPYPQMMAAYDSMAGVAMRRAKIAGELEGLDLAPTKKVGVRVKIAYALAQ